MNRQQNQNYMVGPNGAPVPNMPMYNTGMNSTIAANNTSNNAIMGNMNNMNTGQHHSHPVNFTPVSINNGGQPYGTYNHFYQSYTMPGTAPNGSRAAGNDDDDEDEAGEEEEEEDNDDDEDDDDDDDDDDSEDDEKPQAPAPSLFHAPVYFQSQAPIQLRNQAPVPFQSQPLASVTLPSTTYHNSTAQHHVQAVASVNSNANNTFSTMANNNGQIYPSKPQDDNVDGDEDEDEDEDEDDDDGSNEENNNKDTSTNDLDNNGNMGDVPATNSGNEAVVADGEITAIVVDNQESENIADEDDKEQEQEDVDMNDVVQSTATTVPRSHQIAEANRVSDVLRSVLETLDEAMADRMRGNEAVALSAQDDEALPSLDETQVDLGEVCKDLERVIDIGAMSHMDAEVLVSFAQSLAKTLTNMTDPAELIRTLSRTSMLLRIMSDPNADRRLVSGESLEAAISLCCFAAHDVLYPIIDKNFSTKAGRRVKGHKSAKGKGSNKKKGKGKGRKGGKKRRRGDGNEPESDDINNDELDMDMNDGEEEQQEEMEEEEKEEGISAQDLAGVDLTSVADALAQTLSYLDRAVSCIPRIEDAQLVQLINLCASCLYLDPSKKTKLAAKSSLLQQVSIDLLRSIFRNNVDHRSLVLDELADAVPRLPRTQRSMRTYSIPGHDQAVQLITVTVLEIVQAACGPSKSEPSTIPDYRIAQQTALEFLHKIIEKCAAPQDHVDEEEVKHHRNFLNFFVEDLLEVLHEPNWPAADMVLNSISSYLSNSLKKTAKNASQSSQRFGVQALQLLGNILAQIQRDQIWASENPLRLPNDSDPDLKPSPNELLICPICELGDTEASANRIRCTQCQQCFHVSCLGMSDSFSSFSCDDCVMMQQLKDVSSCVSYNFSSGETDIAAFRQLYLNMLASQRADGSRGASFAYEYCVSLWANEDLKEGGIGEFSRPALRSQWTRRWKLAKKLGAVRTTRTRNSVSRYSQAAIVRHLNLTRTYSLSNKLTGDTMLNRLLHILSTGLPSLRARAVKALGVVLEANHKLMEDKRVQKSVEQRVLDEAISVRESTIDLVGRYTLIDTSLVRDFQEILIQRLSDLGLSVRKRVIKVLRGLLLANAPFPNRNAVLMALVDRIADPQEEPSVRDLVISIFRDLWFIDERDESSAEENMVPLAGRAAPFTPLRKTKSSQIDSMEDSPSPRKSTPVPFRTPMQAVHSARKLQSTAGKYISGLPTGLPTSYTDLVPRKSIKDEDKVEALKRNTNDIMNLAGVREDNQWFVALLKGVLSEEESKIARNTERAHANCVKLVENMMHQLLEIQDEDFDLAEFKANGEIECSDVEGQTMYILRALGLFADAAPTLLLPHLEPLTRYLQRDMLQVRKENLVEASCTILKVATQAIRSSSKPIEHRFAESFANELKQQILSSPSDVMQSSVETLGALCKQYPNLEAHLDSVLKQFTGFLISLQKTRTLDKQPKRMVFNAYRAMLGSGSICLALQKPSSDCLAKVSELLFFRGSDPHAKQPRVVALQALRHIWAKDSQRMITIEADEFIDHALTKDSEPTVRSQVLLTLCELLQLGEERLEGGQAQKSLETATSTRDRIKGDQDSDSAVVASVMQKHAQSVTSLLFDKSSKVRVNAVLLVGTMLRQGLINPLQCIEPMVTLESDEKWLVHDTAHTFLVDLDERHPEFLVTRCVQGIIRSYHYKLENGLSTSAIVPRESEDKDTGDEKRFHVGPLQPTFSIFSRLYKSCLANNAAHRTRFMQTALALFKPEASIFRRSSSNGAPSTSKSLSLEELHFMAETLGTLPYTLWEEPLYLVYQINSITSLHGDALIQLLKPKLAPDLQEHDAMTSGDNEEESISLLAKQQEPLDWEQVREALVALQGINILLELKTYLKTIYSLSESRCEKYNPNETARATEKHLSSVPQKLAVFPKLDQVMVNLLQFKCPENERSEAKLVESLSRPFRAFVDALADDPDDVAVVLESKSGKKRRRKSISAVPPLANPSENATDNGDIDPSEASEAPGVNANLNGMGMNTFAQASSSTPSAHLTAHNGTVGTNGGDDDDDDDDDDDEEEDDEEEPEHPGASAFRQMNVNYPFSTPQHSSNAGVMHTPQQSLYQQTQSFSAMPQQQPALQQNFQSYSQPQYQHQQQQFGQPSYYQNSSQFMTPAQQQPQYGGPNSGFMQQSPAPGNAPIMYGNSMQHAAGRQNQQQSESWDSQTQQAALARQVQFQQQQQQQNLYYQN